MVPINSAASQSLQRAQANYDNAANLHTYSKNPTSLLNKFVSLFTGVRDYVALNQGGERRYVSTKDLASVLNISPKDITSQYKTTRNVDKLIDNLKFNVILKYTGESNDENLKEVIDKIGVASFIFALKNAENKDVMVNTLKEIGKDIKENPDSLKHVKGEASIKHVKGKKAGGVKTQYGYTRTKNGNIFIRTSLLGKGASKTVKKSLDLNTSRMVAGFRLKNEGAVKEAYKETQTARTFKNRRIPNTVDKHMVSYVTKSGKIEKVFAYGEVYNGGDGRSLIQAPLKEILKAAEDVSLAYKGMHAIRMVHNDPKLENLLIQRDEEGKLKKVVVSDYGLTLPTDAEVKLEPNQGRYAYYPPEIHKASAAGKAFLISPKIDSYGLGIMLMEMVLGKVDWNSPIWPQDMPKDQIKMMLEGGLEELKDTMSPKEFAAKKELLNLAADLLDPNPNSRATCEHAQNVIRGISKRNP